MVFKYCISFPILYVHSIVTTKILFPMEKKFNVSDFLLGTFRLQYILRVCDNPVWGQILFFTVWCQPCPPARIVLKYSNSIIKKYIYCYFLKRLYPKYILGFTTGGKNLLLYNFTLLTKIYLGHKIQNVRLWKISSNLICIPLKESHHQLGQKNTILSCQFKTIKYYYNLIQI